MEAFYKAWATEKGVKSPPAKRGDTVLIFKKKELGVTTLEVGARLVGRPGTAMRKG